MPRQLQLTEKQAEYINAAHHRWNFAIGAVRSGKSHLAIQYIIPDRILKHRGEKGLNVILGVSRESLERNVLEPMRNIWGAEMVGTPSSSNRTKLFGETVYCIGAEKVNQVAKIRGSEIKFCYIDEVCDVHQEVFEMLKSRLSLPYSECHAAANPQAPTHYVKQFIDTPDLDIFSQHYTIDDNPFLPKTYTDALKAEYAGTVYYDRYVLGNWTQAEGLVYPMYQDAISKPPKNLEDEGCFIACDYGIQNPFAALIFKHEKDGVWWVVGEYYYDGRSNRKQKTDADYVDDMLSFASELPSETPFIVDPSATSFIEALRRAGRFRIRQAQNDVLDGLRDTAVALQQGVVKISDACTNLTAELAGYVWDEKSTQDRPVKERDHACDALRYGIMTERLHRPQSDYKPIF